MSQHCKCLPVCVGVYERNKLSCGRFCDWLHQKAFPISEIAHSGLREQGYPGNQTLVGGLANYGALEIERNITFYLMPRMDYAG